MSAPKITASIVRADLNDPATVVHYARRTYL
jgi:hypothetical protein